MLYFTRIKSQYCFRNVTNTAQIFERTVTPILPVRCRNVVWITGFSQESCCVVQCNFDFFLGNWHCLRLVCTAGNNKELAVANSQ